MISRRCRCSLQVSCHLNVRIALADLHGCRRAHRVVPSAAVVRLYGIREGSPGTITAKNSNRLPMAYPSEKRVMRSGIGAAATDLDIFPATSPPRVQIDRLCLSLLARMHMRVATNPLLDGRDRYPPHGSRRGRIRPWFAAPDVARFVAVADSGSVKRGEVAASRSITAHE